jgi:hypothetical protein
VPAPNLPQQEPRVLEDPVFQADEGVLDHAAAQSHHSGVARARMRCSAASCRCRATKRRGPFVQRAFRVHTLQSASTAPQMI